MTRETGLLAEHALRLRVILPVMCGTRQKRIGGQELNGICALRHSARLERNSYKTFIHCISAIVGHHFLRRRQGPRGCTPGIHHDLLLPIRRQDWTRAMAHQGLTASGASRGLRCNWWRSQSQSGSIEFCRCVVRNRIPSFVFTREPLPPESEETGVSVAKVEDYHRNFSYRIYCQVAPLPKVFT